MSGGWIDASVVDPNAGLRVSCLRVIGVPHYHMAHLEHSLMRRNRRKNPSQRKEDMLTYPFCLSVLIRLRFLMVLTSRASQIDAGRECGEVQ